MKKPSFLLSFLVAAGACTSGDNDGAVQRDTLTQRQRDSIIGASKLPGARGIGAALRASDSIANRVRVQDSIR